MRVAPLRESYLVYWQHISPHHEFLMLSSFHRTKLVRVCATIEPSHLRLMLFRISYYGNLLKSAIGALGEFSTITLLWVHVI